MAAFQRWAATGIPEGVVRAKGFVTFAEEPGTPYDFHLSGRRRIEIELSSNNGGRGFPNFPRTPAFGSAASPSPPPSSRLVLIGPGLDAATSLAALRALEATNIDGDTAAASLQLAARLAAARQLIADDTRLELVEVSGDWCASPAAVTGCVHFRLTGAASNGFTVGGAGNCTLNPIP